MQRISRRPFYAWKINLSWRALLPFDRLRVWSFFSGSNGCENKQRQRLSQKFHVSLDTKRRTLVASRIWDSLRMLSVVGWILVACRDDLAISLFFVLVQATILFFPFLDRNVFAISSLKYGNGIMNQSRQENN